MSHPTFCVCRLCAPFASQGLTLGLAPSHLHEMAQHQAAYQQGIQAQVAIGGQLSDGYNQQAIKGAALSLTAPDPCGIPGCFVCTGRLGLDSDPRGV